MDETTQSIRLSRYRAKWGIFLIAAVLFLVWVLNTPSGVFGKADAIGYAVCHRIDARSFHIGDRQLPLCVRCSGQYLGAVFGLFYLTLISRRRTGMPPLSIVATLVVFAILYAVDGVNSYFHLQPMMEVFPEFPRLYEPTNVMRLITGSGMGFIISILLYPTFNRTVWLKYDKRPVIGNFKQLLMGIILLFILDLLILTENPVVLYPLSIISTMGVLFLLSMVYSLVITMVFHLENKFDNIAQLILPLTAGFVVALLQIALLDAVRYLVTGTWEGFQL